MKNLYRSIMMTLSLCAFLAVGYVFVLWVFAQLFSPNRGNAETVEVDGKIVGAANVGQTFTQDKYFWGRPSAVDYNAAGSGGSNKGTNNPEYLKDVEGRVDAFLKAHPYLKKSEVPSEMVTASGSGLDPDISPKGAYVQVKRVAKARNLDEARVMELVKQSVQTPLLGLFGTEKVNVLKLNTALDRMGGNSQPAQNAQAPEAK